MVHPVRHGLSHFRSDARNLREILADLFHDLCLAPIQRPRHDFDFTGVNACGMFIEFGTAGPSRCGNHFRRPMEGFLDDPADAIGFLQGGPRR